MIVIIGGGLAGLTCAKCLADAGCTDFVVVEARSEVGGRVATERFDGFTLDHGFQVLLDRYPAVRRHLDVPALDPRCFDSGAILADSDTGRTARLYNPIRHPWKGLRHAAGSVIPFDDQAAMAAIALEALRTRDGDLVSDDRQSTIAFLEGTGMSDETIARFVRPFFGGVFLDEKLSTSAGLFLSYLKRFALSRALVPARGMAEIPRQLAGALPDGSVLTGTRVASLRSDRPGSRIRMVVPEGGRAIPCRAVVVATDPWQAAPLVASGDSTTSRRPEPPARGTTVLYFTTPVALYDEPLLVLPSARAPLVRHFVQITNVAPECAPPGVGLVSATVLNERGLSEGELFARASGEITGLFPRARGVLEPLRRIRIPHALPIQNPGFRSGRLPAPDTDNLVLAGDHTTHASIEGAMTSGETAARHLLKAGLARPSA